MLPDSCLLVLAGCVPLCALVCLMLDMVVGVKGEDGRAAVMSCWALISERFSFEILHE